MLEIITKNNLSGDQKKTLNEFNDLYTKWNDSDINEYTFIEMQAKLLTLQQFIINSIKKNTGLIQMCKIKPKIKLHYIGIKRMIDLQPEPSQRAGSRRRIR